MNIIYQDSVALYQMKYCLNTETLKLVNIIPIFPKNKLNFLICLI